jgi:hypothetical protein
VAAVEIFEVGEPEEVVDGDAESGSETAGGFDGRQIPRCCGGDGLHALRIGEVVVDNEAVGTALEVEIAEEEFDYIAVTWAGVVGEGLCEAAGQAAKPRAAAAENECGTIEGSAGREIPGE